MERIRKFLFLTMLLSPATLLAVNLESVSVIALGPLDGRAVVKTADGKMQVLKLGDTIPGTKAIVTQVLTDKLVVEETIERQGQAPKVQTVWIMKPKKAGEKSTVQRLEREAPPTPPALVPAVREVQP